MKTLNFKAILVAFITDFAVTQLLATPLSLITMLAVPQARAMMLSGNATALTTFLSNWPPFLILGVLCACGGEVLGGLVAGSLAPLHPKRNAIATALVAILTSLFLTGSYPLWCRVVAIALVVPCYWLGALWAMRRNAKKSTRQHFMAEGAPIAPPR